MEICTLEVSSPFRVPSPATGARRTTGSCGHNIFTLRYRDVFNLASSPTPQSSPESGKMTWYGSSVQWFSNFYGNGHFGKCFALAEPRLGG